MLPTLYQFWEIFYKYKSDCVICLPEHSSGFPYHFDINQTPSCDPHDPQGLPLLLSPNLPPPTLSILHSPPSTLPPSGWAISSFKIFKWPFNPTEPLPSHQAQQSPYPNGINQNVCSSEKPSLTTRHEFRCCKLWSLCNLGEIFLRKNCKS